MQLLNIGCGNRIHNDWVNIDKAPASQSVRQCDVENGLPFSDCSFDVVYHSHVLEHFTVNDAPQFLAECHRVLKPGGLIRVVVPDLEQIVLCYLQALQKVSDGRNSARDDYDWMMLEMYDQTVRNVSGGQMAAFLNRPDILNRDFVTGRCGGEIDQIMRQFSLRRDAQQHSNESARQTLHPRFSFQLKKIPKKIREWILKTLLRDEYKALEIGRFRCSGENHQWMYDRVSLAGILRECGFRNIVQQDARGSSIGSWTKYNLDTESDGVIYKPDSLYIEAVKP